MVSVESFEEVRVHEVHLVRKGRLLQAYPVSVDPRDDVLRLLEDLHQHLETLQSFFVVELLVILQKLISVDRPVVFQVDVLSNVFAQNQVFLGVVHVFRGLSGLGNLFLDFR